MIHSKQWRYSLHRDFQQLHSTHSTQRDPRDSSSTNSTSRRQRALRLIPFILHAEGKETFNPEKTFYVQKARRSSIQSTRPYKGIPGIPAARPSKDNPVIHDIPDIPVIHDIQPSRHYSKFQHFQYVPVHQYIPVLSSTFQCIQGFHPISAFSN